MTTESVSLENVLPPGHGEHILFVDDEPGICHLAEIVFEQIGYRVTAHTNPEPEEALLQFREAPDRFALVVSNLTMPRLTGVELAQQILLLRPRIPILGMTDFSSDWTLERLREFGIRDLIGKPMTLGELTTAVHRLLYADGERGANL
jgi:CheY-like chemotaxis protein